jgi:hypothetical protein
MILSLPTKMYLTFILVTREAQANREPWTVLCSLFYYR